MLFRQKNKCSVLFWGLYTAYPPKKGQNLTDPQRLVQVQVLYSCDIKVHTTHRETTKEQAHRVMASLTTRYTCQ